MNSAQQHRLSRIQLANWGTFHGYHDLPVPRQGLLLTGDSGTGKSTLLDAMATLLVPPKWSSFNAAAQQSTTGDRARNLATYVRGANRRSNDTETGQVAVTYLRTGATWSGVALTFEHHRQTTSIVLLLHLARGSNSPAEVSRLYLLADGPVDLMALAPYVANGLDQRRLKAERPDWKPARTYSAFSTRLQRRFGFAGEQALRLLHKTQSAKNLNNLNHLLREFMLDEPDTFELAEQALDQFTELAGAHDHVIDARRQVEALTPLRERVAAHDRAQQLLHRSTAQAAHLDRYLLTAKLARLSTEVDQQTAAEAGLAATAQAADHAVRQAQEDRDDRRRTLDGIAGNLPTLEKVASLRADELRRVERAHDRARERAEQVGLSLPASAGEHAGWLTALRRTQAELTTDAADRALHRALATRHGLTADRESLQQEIKVLQEQRSNLGLTLVTIRSMLSRELGVPAERLPFAGELIDIRPEEAGWQGAIERVLRPLAQTLLVPEDLYARLARVVNAAQLRGRLVYARLVDQRPGELPEPADSSLLHRIEVVTGEHHDWLSRRLRTRYDYDCVEDAAALALVSRGVTRSGQVKHNASQHEKDDRHAIGDRTRWVLGSSTEAKQQALAQKLADIQDRELEAENEARQVQQERDELRDRRSQLAELLRLDWADLDLDTARERLQQAQEELHRLRASTADLPEAERRLDQAEKALVRARSRQQRCATELSGLRTAIEQNQSRIERYRRELAAAPETPEDVSHGLAEDWPLPAGPIDAIDEIGAAARRAIAERRVAAQESVGREAIQAGRLMLAYKTGWKHRAADLSAEMAFAPEFLRLLDALEADGLPRFEDRFFTLLQSQSRNNIGALSMRIRGSRSQIRARVDPINASLRRTEFSPGHHLEVRVQDRNLPVVTDFLAELNEITSESLTEIADAEDPAARVQAEQRFTRMQSLMARLGSRETADANWRTQCLDTRQHVEFQALVRDREGKQTDVFEDSGGLSGGERQKLVTFCLAAALRYQLARDGADLPEYALVILDEAFDKTDPSFTRAGLEVFRDFGFQLLLATPMKMLQTLEDYVGGVAVVHLEPDHRSRLSVLPFDHAEPSAGEDSTGIDPPESDAGQEMLL